MCPTSLSPPWGSRLGCSMNLEVLALYFCSWNLSSILKQLPMPLNMEVKAVRPSIRPIHSKIYEKCWLALEADLSLLYSYCMDILARVMEETELWTSKFLARSAFVFMQVSTWFDHSLRHWQLASLWNQNALGGSYKSNASTTNGGIPTVSRGRGEWRSNVFVRLLTPGRANFVTSLTQLFTALSRIAAVTLTSRALGAVSNERRGVRGRGARAGGGRSGGSYSGQLLHEQGLQTM